MHYSRFRSHGTPNAPGKADAGKLCLVPDCDMQPVAKGQCKTHYYANRNRRMLIAKGEALAFGPQAYSIDQSKSNAWRPDLRKPCAVEGCPSNAKVRGLCGAHYQRLRRFGDAEFSPPEANKSCSISGCDRVTNAHGLCDPHYYRLRTFGDPEATPIRSKPKLQPQPPRACATCGEMFDPGNSAVRKYCGRNCRPTRTSMGVQKRRTVEALGRANGWVCHLCKEPVDRTLYWPNRFAGSVDHVIPVFHGGKDDFSNLALAHLTCNTARGRKLG